MKHIINNIINAIFFTLMYVSYAVTMTTLTGIAMLQVNHIHSQSWFIPEFIRKDMLNEITYFISCNPDGVKLAILVFAAIMIALPLLTVFCKTMRKDNMIERITQVS